MTHSASQPVDESVIQPIKHLYIHTAPTQSGSQIRYEDHLVRPMREGHSVMMLFGSEFIAWLKLASRPGRDAWRPSPLAGAAGGTARVKHKWRDER
eukprot:scaffold235562_cov25-Prasinocladus_malaysianus.AAC.1